MQVAFSTVSASEYLRDILDRETVTREAMAELTRVEGKIAALCHASRVTVSRSRISRRYSDADTVLNATCMIAFYDNAVGPASIPDGRM